MCASAAATESLGEPSAPLPASGTEHLIGPEAWSESASEHQILTISSRRISSRSQPRRRTSSATVSLGMPCLVESAVSTMGSSSALVAAMEDANGAAGLVWGVGGAGGRGGGPWSVLPGGPNNGLATWRGLLAGCDAAAAPLPKGVLWLLPLPLLCASCGRDCARSSKAATVGPCSGACCGRCGCCAEPVLAAEIRRSGICPPDAVRTAGGSWEAARTGAAVGECPVLAACMP